MFRLPISHILVLAVLLQTHYSSVHGKYRIGKLRQEKEKEHGEENENKENEPDDTYVRHVIEYGVKNPLFGSSRFDPIKQVFVAGKKKNCPEKPKKEDGISTAMDGQSDQTTTTEPPKAEITTQNRKQFVSAGAALKSRTIKVPRNTFLPKVTKRSLEKKPSKKSVKTIPIANIKKIETTSEGWWSRQHRRRNYDEAYGDINDLQFK